MIAHNLPRPGGKLSEPQYTGQISGYGWVMYNSRKENHLMFIEKYLEEGITFDAWWMDLGWFVRPEMALRLTRQKPQPHEYPLEEIGNFTVDYHRFPNGIRRISDLCHENGMRTILWFEPEHMW